jgi:hypothetical protein
MKILILLFMMVLIADFAVAQDIEGTVNKIKNLKKAPGDMLRKGFTASGSISSASNLLQSNLMLPGQRPFEESLNGNILFDIGGKIKMPFTFAWNTRSVNYSHPFNKKYKLQQPFNRFQFKPTYKGFSLLLGVNSLSFSEYTLNAFRFEGLGFTFKPAKMPFYASFLTGILNKPISPDSASLLPNMRPSYKRTGLGFQVGFKIKKNKAEVSFLQGRDRKEGFPYNLDFLGISPKKNVTVGLKGDLMMGKFLALKTDIALSAMLEDTRTFNQETKLFKNTATNYYKAIKTGLQYNGQKIKTGLQYAYVDPQYRSMGIYYVADDLESLAADIGTQFLDGKISLQGSLGKQGQTRKSLQSQTLDQWVGSLNVAIAPSEKFTSTLLYSNFISFTNLRTDLEYLTVLAPFSILDTLNYRQVNQNIMATSTYVFAKDEKIQNTLNLNLMQQMTNSAVGSEATTSKIANAALMFDHADQNTALAYGGGFTVSRNDLVFLRDWLLGPSVHLSKSFLDKTLSSGLNINYLSTKRTDNLNSKIINASVNASYTIKKKHALSLTGTFLNRAVDSNDEFDRSSWQLMASLNYRYSFDLFKIAKK